MVGNRSRKPGGRDERRWFNSIAFLQYDAVTEWLMCEAATLTTLVQFQPASPKKCLTRGSE
jgi:hypothetical protein